MLPCVIDTTPLPGLACHPPLPSNSLLPCPCFALPCPAPSGKGPSEWHYSWIPFFATFAGGAIAGGFFLAVQLMNHSVVPRG